MGGRAQRLPPRRIADDHDGGLCFEPVAVVVVVVVVVVVSRYMHTSLMGVVLTSPYIPTSTLWLKE